MRRYLGIGVGLGLLLVVLAVTNAGPALAQGPFKPVMAFIINDSAHPVPVTVVANTDTTVPSWCETSTASEHAKSSPASLRSAWPVDRATARAL